MRVWLLILCAALLCAGCKKEESITTYRAPKEPPAIAQEAEVLPAAVPAQGQIAWSVPAGWRAQQPESIESAHFVANAETPPLAVTVVALNAAANSLLPNLNRWEQQLGLPPSPPQDVDKSVRNTEVDGQPAQLIHLTNPQPPARRTLAAIVTHGDKDWFFKMSGPADQVTAQAKNFASFVSSAHFTAPPAPPTAEAGAVAGLAAFSTPAGWQRDATTNAFRVLGFAIGAGDQQAQVSVARIGAQSAGSILDNLNRWRGQVALDPISDDGLYQPTGVAVGELTGSLFDVTAVRAPADFPKRMLVVIANDGKNLWFFKLTGAAATVTAQQGNFRDFLASLRFAATGGQP